MSIKEIVKIILKCK